MNKLQALQSQIRSLFYATYEWGTYFTWQYKNKFLERMDAEGLPPEWIEAKRLPPAKVQQLRELCKKHYPRLQW